MKCNEIQVKICITKIGRFHTSFPGCVKVFKKYSKYNRILWLSVGLSEKYAGSKSGFLKKQEKTKKGI